MRVRPSTFIAGCGGVKKKLQHQRGKQESRRQANYAQIEESDTNEKELDFFCFEQMESIDKK